LGIGLSLMTDQFETGCYHLQQVVEVMGDTAGQLSDRVQPLGVREPFFRPTLFGNIATYGNDLANFTCCRIPDEPAAGFKPNVLPGFLPNSVGGGVRNPFFHHPIMTFAAVFMVFWMNEFIDVMAQKIRRLIPEETPANRRHVGVRTFVIVGADHVRRIVGQQSVTPFAVGQFARAFRDTTFEFRLIAFQILALLFQLRAMATFFQHGCQDGGKVDHEWDDRLERLLVRNPDGQQAIGCFAYGYIEQVTIGRTGAIRICGGVSFRQVACLSHPRQTLQPSTDEPKNFPLVREMVNHALDEQEMPRISSSLLMTFRHSRYPLLVGQSIRSTRKTVPNYCAANDHQRMRVQDIH